MKRLFIWIVLLSLFLISRPAYAQQTDLKCGTNGINTALGCIETEGPGGVTSTFFKIGIGMAGGIAFLLILYGGFKIMTSAGNPEKLNEGKELVGSAVAGLLFIILSIFLLKVIGVDILGIPGFS